jgi:ATP-dependent Clp protease ATP-binding subunit ClpC
MLERYTEAARRALFFARYAATEHGGEALEAEHVLLGLLHGNAEALLPLRFTPVTLDSMETALAANLSGRQKLPTHVDIPFSERAKDLLKQAVAEADNAGSREIRPIHLLAAILVESRGVAFITLRDHGITLADVRTMAGPDRP